MSAEPGDELYDLEPGSFTAARDALVRKLRSEGRRDEAAAVAKRRRPSTLAWGLDRVARRAATLVDEALAAGQQLRAATEAALSGEPGELRTATAADHDATNALVNAALAEIGSADPHARARLVATVRAAVLDDDVADQLRGGVLVTDHTAVSVPFGTAEVHGSSPSAGSRPSPRSERDRRRAQAELDERARRAASRAERLAGDAGAAEAEATRLRHEADQAAKEAEAAQQAAARTS